jgi:hypothetical protein
MTQPVARQWWNRPSTGALLVVVAAVAVYANTLANGFVYDDLHQVLEDPRIRSLGGVSEIFTQGVWSFKWGPSSYYRPMMQLSYLLTYQVAGLAPWAYHLVNVLLHAGASLALYALASRVLADHSRVAAPGATAAGLVFALHPLHTEPVSWIAAVGDLQLALYGLLTILLYVLALDGRRWAYGGALGCYALALLSKEPAVALPAILLAVQLSWSRQRTLRDAWTRLTPFALLVVGYLLVRRWVLGGVAPPGLHGEVDPVSAGLTAIYYLGRYVVSCVWPFPLNVLYEFRPVHSPVEFRMLISVLVCCAVAAVVVRFRRDRRVLLAAVLFAVPLAPALYIPGLGAGGLAERYMYLPLAGFSLGAGIVWLAVWRRWTRTVIAPLLFGLLLTAAGAATVSRNLVWKDEETLWEDTVRKSPGSAIAHEFLGYGYLQSVKLDEAIAASRRALELDPLRTNARINVGAALLAAERFEEAAVEYRAALEQGSTMLEAHVGLGFALINLGSYAAARQHLEAAVAENPSYATVQDALGVACANLGDLRAAEAAFAEAVALDPATPGYRDHLDSARRDLARTQRPAAE